MGSVGNGLNGEVDAKAVELVTSAAARTKRTDNEIEDIGALLPWFKLCIKWYPKSCSVSTTKVTL
jgi:hypothetical protein